MSEETDIFAHRRGLMLGLTLAELLMLVLFILLLTYTVLIGQKEKQIADREARLAEARSQVASMNVQVDQGISGLMAALESQGMPIPNMTELDARLREITHEMGQLKTDNEKLSRLVPTAEIAEQLAEALDQVPFAPNAATIIEEWLEENALQQLDGVGTQQDERVPETLEDALSKIDRLQRQLEFHERRMEQAGNGLTYPPCWARAGKPVYIYDALLQDNGLTLTAVDNRTGQDMAGLKANGPEPILGEQISFSNFLNRTRGLFVWSVGERCRFYVRIRDGTSADNKTGYKQARRTVEQHFYIYDAN